eukprot:jgi/Mesen1/960/ME000012S00512
MAGRSILVLNAGSSSLKYSLFKVSKSLQLSVQGLVEQIGTSHGSITHRVLNDEDKRLSERGEFEDHKAALSKVVSLLHFTRAESKSIMAVGHRVVHGGEAISAPKIITDEVKAAIEHSIPLAPLHNPANLQGIRVAEELFDCPQVAVFDTAFHSTIRPHAYIYGLPYKFYEENKIRRYGFHGTSYLYLLKETARMLRKPVESVNMIALHLGAGASMAAIQEGKCIDTTMGVTPLEGLVMATRSGDVDPAVVGLLARLRGLSVDEIDSVLNKQSGMYGVCGDKDMKSVVERAVAGEPRCQLALDVYVHRLRKYVGAYLVHLRGEVDAIVFSGGVGERSAYIRALACEGLERFGFAVDASKNERVKRDGGQIQSDESRVRVLMIPTDEELSIAQQTFDEVHSLQPGCAREE